MARRTMPIFRQSSCFLGLLACALSCASEVPAPAKTRPPRIEVEIDVPSPDSQVQGRVREVLVRGTVLLEGAVRPGPVDLMVLLDVSPPTRFPSGLDVDADGEFGFDPREYLLTPDTLGRGAVCSDPEDTILHAELAALRKLIDHSDPDRVRIGMVPFTSRQPGVKRRKKNRSARVMPLSHRYRVLRDSLVDLLSERPEGAASLRRALKIARHHLKLDPNEAVEPQRLVLVLTGVPGLSPPSLPPVSAALDHGISDSELALVRALSDEGIGVRVFGIGAGAWSPPIGASELARWGRGEYAPAMLPSDVTSYVDGDATQTVDRVVLTNLQTGISAADVTLTRDGTFSSRVPIEGGENQILVSPVTPLKVVGETQVQLRFDPEEPTLWELLVELEQVRASNRELILLMEEDRIRRGGEGQVEVELAPQPGAQPALDGAR